MKEVILQVLTCKHRVITECVRFELSLAGNFFIALSYLILCISDQKQKY